MEGDELPTGWAWATLNDLGAIVSGGTPNSNDPACFDGEIAWVTPADLTGYTAKTIARGRRNLTEHGLATCSAKIMPPRSVLFSSRAPIGYVAIASNEISTNQGFKSVVPHQEIDESYLYFYLKSAKQLAEQNASGTTFKEISGSRFGRLPVPVAPFPEQQRIVEKIETLFAELNKGEEALREVQKLLARYRQSVLKAAVTGELTGNGSANWEPVVLGDLLEDIRYGTAKKCRADVEGTAVLRIPNVVGGEIDLADLKFTSLTVKELEKLSLREGDILIVRSNGSANLVGRGAIVTPEAVGMAYAGYLIRLRLDHTRITPAFLHIVLSSPAVRARIERQAKSTSGVHNLNSAEVRAIAFDLPDLETQAAVVEAVEEALSRIAHGEAWCAAELKRGAALRQSILKDAFSGKLVPQDPTDEPAEELLARITAERSAKSKPTRKKALA